MFGFILQYLFSKCWKFKGGIGGRQKIVQKNPREQPGTNLT